MQEGTTSRVTVADRPYGEFYNFYSVSPENSGYHLVYTFLSLHKQMSSNRICWLSFQEVILNILVKKS